MIAGKRRLFVELFIMERRTRQEGRGSSPLHLLHLGILVPDALFLGSVVVDIKPRDASFEPVASRFGNLSAALKEQIFEGSELQEMNDPFVRDTCLFQPKVLEVGARHR